MLRNCVYQSNLKVCLVSPLPPPYGGIGHWTSLMHRYAIASKKVKFIQVDTAPRWRAIYNSSLFLRTFGGAFQLMRDCVIFLSALLGKPDVVHLTTSGSLALVRDYVVCAMSHLFGVPVTYHLCFGRVPEIAATNTLEWRFLSMIMRFADVTVSITPATTDTIKRQLPNIRVIEIPNPIDCSRLPTATKSANDKRVVLFIGWVIPTKGVEELVRAWSELAFEGWDLLLVGPGDMAYQQRLIERYRPQNMKFIGVLEHDEVMRMIAQCDLFVLPSYTEGFPNVILEAMVLGRPIIATLVGAIPAMLSGGCGWLIPPRDVEALKTAFTQLIKNEYLRRKLGECALKRVRKNYSLDIVFNSYVRLWENLKAGKLPSISQ